MEKKGEILNQLAIISDLMENANIVSQTNEVIFTLPESEYNRIFKLITAKINIQMNNVNDTFSVKIGVVDFIFNKSSV